MSIHEDGNDRYVLESFVIDDEGYRIGLLRITFSSSPENALGKAHEIHSAMRSELTPLEDRLFCYRIGGENA